MSLPGPASALDVAAAAAGSCGVDQGKVESCMKGETVLGTVVAAGTAVVGYVWCAGEEWLERRVVPEDVVGHGIAVVGDGIAVVGGDDSATAERNWRQQQGAPTLVRHVRHRCRCEQHPSARARPHRIPYGSLRHSMQTAKRMHSH